MRLMTALTTARIAHTLSGSLAKQGASFVAAPENWWRRRPATRSCDSRPLVPVHTNSSRKPAEQLNRNLRDAGASFGREGATVDRNHGYQLRGSGDCCMAPTTDSTAADDGAYGLRTAMRARGLVRALDLRNQRRWSRHMCIWCSTCSTVCCGSWMSALILRGALHAIGIFRGGSSNES